MVISVFSLKEVLLPGDVIATVGFELPVAETIINTSSVEEYTPSLTINSHL